MLRREARASLGLARAVLGLALALPATAGAQARGDFDGDGFDDVAVGVPGEALGGLGDVGLVHVVNGGPNGIEDTATTITQNTPNVDDGEEQFDSFGEVLVAGDFNGDDVSDLAISATGEFVGAVDTAGAVNVLYGGANGLQTADDDDLLFQGQPGIGETPETSDRFGATLAAGDFDQDGDDELVVGVPQEDDGATQGTGLVHVIPGTPAGLSPSLTTTLTQETTGVPGTADAFDLFGLGLAAADLVGDAGEELVVASPNEVIGGDAIGNVIVFGGIQDGVDPAGTAVDAGTPGVPGPPQVSSGFGRTMAIGDFGPGPRQRLAIASAFQDVGGKENAGSVAILKLGTEITGTRLTQATKGLLGRPGKNARFGSALLAANLGRGSRADLIIAADGDKVKGEMGAGLVHVLYGSGEGLRAAGSTLLHQDVKGVAGVAEAYEGFGGALGAGQFGMGATQDLLVGVGEGIGTEFGAGAVHLLYGRSKGISTKADRFLRQGKPPLGETLEATDFVGEALAP